QEVFAWQDVKHVPKTASSAENDVPPDVSKQLTVLLAGHDFKFFSEISTSIRQAGHRIIVDHWESHTDHDEESSRRLLAEADVIFCEWSLGNIRWYSHNKLPGQKLVTRFHAQELRTKFLREADINNIDTFIFVSPAGMRRAQVLFSIPDEKCTLIGNTFNFDNFDKDRYAINPKTHGLVCRIPESKRIDLAHDVLEQLRAEDSDYRLVIQGNKYTHYPWLLSREKETTYFETQYKRIENSPELYGAVKFGGYNPNIAELYL